MKYSRQRESVLRAVRDSHSHPTADDVYTVVKTQYPKVSLGTVYRNLNLLAELGEIRRIAIPGGSDRFDGNMTAHFHMCCEGCGCIQDIELTHLDGIKQHILNTTGFTVDELDLFVRGYCKDCAHNKSA